MQSAITEPEDEMMKRAIRKVGAVGVFTAILAGVLFAIGTSRIAEA